MINYRTLMNMIAIVIFGVSTVVISPAFIVLVLFTLHIIYED